MYIYANDIRAALCETCESNLSTNMLRQRNRLKMMAAQRLAWKNNKELRDVVFCKVHEKCILFLERKYFRV